MHSQDQSNQSTSQNVPSNETDTNINYWFIRPSSPGFEPFPIEIPRDTYSKATRYSRQLFQHELREEHGFSTNLRDIKFWRPKKPFYLSETNWKEFLDSSQRSRIHLPISFSSALADTDNKNLIHLIVTATKDEAPSMEDGYSIIEKWRSRHTVTELPAIIELARIADLPLPEDEKIPIPPHWMQLLATSTDDRDVCRLDDVKLLFRTSPATVFLSKFFYTALEAPPITRTEDSFHSFWDQNLREILERLIPDGRSYRNSGQYTAVRRLCPDYAFIVNKLCPFRGEEKGPNSNENPRDELLKKVAWAYDPAPYVLGYYVTESDLTLVAITPPSEPRGLPGVHDIAHANLSNRRDRIKNMCRLINLAGLFRPLANLVRSPDAEFELFERDYGTVEILGHYVVKTYTSWDRNIRVSRLKNTYHYLGEKKVPHVDSLTHHHETSCILSPRGISSPPRTENELLNALVCVLEALQVLHRPPPIFHRDIRWENVMRQIDDNQKWFIIDWDDASTPPTEAQPYFDRKTHSPRIFIDNHGAEVDIWGVGELILRCEPVSMSLELQALAKVDARSSTLGE